MAIGALFYGEDGAGVLGQFQRNEYSRYSRDIRRRRGRVFVLTGTASLFRATALRTVAQSRGSSIPGAPGDVYDTASLTEDNELTIALKSLGALMISPSQCTVVIQVMPSWRALWNQRLRWQRGELENLGAYGLRPKTFRYWAQQLGIGYGVIALAGYIVLIMLTVLSVSAWVWFPFWMGLGLLFAVERVVTVWVGGWRARLLAAAILPELAESEHPSRTTSPGAVTSGHSPKSLPRRSGGSHARPLLHGLKNLLEPGSVWGDGRAPSDDRTHIDHDSLWGQRFEVELHEPLGRLVDDNRRTEGQRREGRLEVER